MFERPYRIQKWTISLLILTCYRCGIAIPIKGSSQAPSSKTEHALILERLLNETPKQWVCDSDQICNDTSRIELRKELSNVLGNLDVSLIADELEQSYNKHLTCESCVLTLEIINLALSLGTSQSLITTTLLNNCIYFKIHPEKVCRGLIEVYKDEGFFILAKTPLTTKEICTTKLKHGCNNGQVTERQKWVVSLPANPKPPLKSTSIPQDNRPTSTILHISDAHMDPFYTEGSPADCEEPLCCRNDSTATGTKRAARKWGEYGNCDIPPRTIEDMFQYITSHHKIDYIIWTGDIAPHDSWNQTRPGQLDYIEKTMDMILRFFPDTIVFPVVGNHDAAPPDSFPPPLEGVPESLSISWLYEGLWNYWKTWLPASTYASIQKGGYYAVQVKPGLRIISLNTNFCFFANWWLQLNVRDPGDQLSWLVDNLQDAENKGEKVYIIGHIAPGDTDCVKVWSDNFYNIVNRYEDTVAAQFYGHTHRDEFEIFYDLNNKTRATNVAYIGPSMGGFEGVNPAYRLYTVAQDQPHDIIDHETYSMNLDEANKVGQPIWKKLYSAKEAYNMTSLQPQEWSDLVTRMKKDKALFDQFYRYYCRDGPNNHCSTECRNKRICDLTFGRLLDPKTCLFT